MKKTVLIADDDESVLWVLERYFTERGFATVTATDGTEAETLLSEKTHTLALLDINMPGKTGLDILKDVKKRKSPAPAVIIMTADGTMKTTIEAMKLGALDYINKPVDLDELDIIIDKALEAIKLKQELSSLKERFKEKLSEETVFIGKTRSIEQVFKTIGKVAAEDVTVLIQGESGTGKELIAKLLHSNSDRAEGPFIAINTAALPDTLLESELFGFEKGAFTGAAKRSVGKFELARGGTLFLDEIGDMEMGLQAHLLRVIQEREFYRLGGTEPVKVDARIICATNQDIKKAIEEKRFREDLYYRLNVVTIELPPLRKRKKDIEPLANHFFQKFSRDMNVEERHLSKFALEELQAYPWPGNVRELENILRRAVLLSPNIVLGTEDLQLPRTKGKKTSIEDIITEKLEPFIDRITPGTNQELYDTLMPFMERPLIKLVLKKTNFNQVKAAEMLGINRNTLRKKIKDLNIKAKDVK